ncbi:hypothetical protein SAMN03159512_04839, partial [Pseudomonas sp. NFR09]|uniref:CdiA C-terminal domain-containing protein n=2 Tax=unclassified Pseudomonas TaxID=196821 RepID=UPI0008AEEF05
ELSLQQDIDAIVSCQADPSSCAASSKEVANTLADLNAIRDIADYASPDAREAVQSLINGNYEFQEMLATATTEHSVGAMVESLKSKWALSDAQAQDIADNLKIALAVGVGTAAGVVAYRRAVAGGAKDTASGLVSGETSVVGNGKAAANDASYDGAKGVLRIDPNGKFTQSEINSAYYMAAQGKKVELRSPVGTRAGGNTSDLLVDGVRYDVYTPTTGNADRIISAIAKKNTQTEGVVLDLSKSSVTREQLGDVLRRVNGSGAKNINDVVIIGK